MEYLSLGKITGTFGLDGSIKVYSTTNNAKMRYQKGASVFLYNPNDKSRKEYKVLSYKKSGVFDIVLLEGITVDMADTLESFEVQVQKRQEDLEVGYYYYSDLEGCEIIDESNNSFGVVKKVEEFPAQITLRVARKNGKDFFVPFIKQFIKNVDIKAKKITIEVMEGML